MHARNRKEQRGEESVQAEGNDASQKIELSVTTAMVRLSM
jgi:hypothetical protein